MNWRRFMSIVRKERQQLFRDPGLLGLFIMAPILEIVFIGFAVNTDLKGVRVGVVLGDPSPEARRLVDAIDQLKELEVRQVSMGGGDPTDWLDRGTVQVVVQIPPGFTRALANGQAPVVQVLSDGSDANTAILAYQYLSGAAMLWASQARVDYLRRHPEAAIRFAGVPQVQLAARFWYNPGLESVNYMIPGVLTVILLVVAMAQTALAVVKEKELGTKEQLDVTPIRPVELLVAKTIMPLVLGLGTGLFITLVARFVFDVPVRGSPVALLFWFLCSALYLVNTMGLGLLVSIKSPTQLLAQLFSNVLISPLLVLSGFLFPIDNMPTWAQWLSWGVPTRHFMEVVRGVFLKGQGPLELWGPALMLVVLGLIFYLAGIFLYRKRVD
jgi:ABC-2 type transport system permease protein